jgi:Single-stranded DNA-binding protein, Bacteriophage T7
VSQRAKIHQTPAGIAQDPWLTTPDTQIDARGQYKVTLLLPIERTQSLIALVDNALAQSLAQAKNDDPARAKRIKPTANKPYNKVMEEDGKETGAVSFRFGLLAKFTNKQTGQTLIHRPDLFDAKCRPLDPTKIDIGGGSTIKVAFEMLPFYMSLLGAGVSLRLWPSHPISPFRLLTETALVRSPSPQPARFE